MGATLRGRLAGWWHSVTAWRKRRLERELARTGQRDTRSGSGGTKGGLGGPM
jgi:hypothetical protein